MEKPNISKGEWEVVENNEVMIHRVYSEGAYVTGGLRKQDAQAISAVPDMIDALLDAREAIIKIESEWQGSIPQRKTIEKALKKAGCKETEKV